MFNKGYKITIDEPRMFEDLEDFFQRKEDEGFELLCQNYQFPNQASWVFAQPKD